MNIPHSGGIFIFGGSRLNGNSTSCFWLKNDLISSASCGDEHTALMTEKGKVYVFGSNNWGQLGLGHTRTIEKPTCIRSLSSEIVTLVACGRNHTLVYTQDNKLFGFGSNSDYQLAEQSLTSSESPIQIDTKALGKIEQIGAGADFSAVLTEKGTVYVWGSNAEGQLGLGKVINEATEPTLLQMPAVIKSMGCGYYHTALVSKSGELYTFGEDEFGKLGDRGTGDHCLPCSVKFSVPVIVEKVACGGSHTAFVSGDKLAYTFGGGFHGQLGHGEDMLETVTPKLVEYFRGQKVSQIHCGENFSSVVLENGSLYTFGDGRKGKLALYGEDFSNQFIPCFCRRLGQYKIKFASCGGCHMVVSACMKSNQRNELERADGNSIEPLLHNIEDSCVMIEGTSQMIRSLSAREKRRKARSKTCHQTLPPLSSLNSDELEEAVKTLSKSLTFQHSFSKDRESTLRPNFGPKDLDEQSDVSALNKVHSMVKSNGHSTFEPISVATIAEPKFDTPPHNKPVPHNAAEKTQFGNEKKHSDDIIEEIGDDSIGNEEQQEERDTDRHLKDSEPVVADKNIFEKSDNDSLPHKEGNASPLLKGERMNNPGVANKGDNKDDASRKQDTNDKQASDPQLGSVVQKKASANKKSKFCTIL